MRHTADFWLKVVREYLSGKTRMTDLSKKYQMDIGKIKYRVNLYQMHGELPFFDEYEKRIDQLREAIHKWIKYYNEERIVSVPLLPTT